MARNGAVVAQSNQLTLTQGIIVAQNSYQLSTGQLQSFQDDGYVIVPELFDREETDLLRTAAEADPVMNQHTIDVDDRSGKSSQITVWNHPGDGIWGMVSRSRRIVDAMELMLGGEVYHYHSKLLLKKPEVGGAWEWHQDYGYWYKNGCLYPYLASCWIALDRADKSNGCMQVIKGSHLAGRIDHGIHAHGLSQGGATSSWRCVVCWARSAAVAVFDRAFAGRVDRRIQRLAHATTGRPRAGVRLGGRNRAPRGAREPGGMQGPTNGLSQQPVEAGGSLTLGAQGKVEAASTTTEWSGTSRHSTSGKQDGMV